MMHTILLLLYSFKMIQFNFSHHQNELSINLIFIREPINKLKISMTPAMMTFSDYQNDNYPNNSDKKRMIFYFTLLFYNFPFFLTFNFLISFNNDYVHLTNTLSIYID